MFASFACLPHARGGVSILILYCKGSSGSSPRAWGCFFDLYKSATSYVVFPTRVGVFLQSRLTFPINMSLPHARGGVSRQGRMSRAGEMSSPRAWGCFPFRQTDSAIDCVFPTRVGVFPPSSLSSWILRCLPHARGGVSPCDMRLINALLSSPRAWGCF